MELSTAVSLIEKGIKPGPSQQWADLGAGNGLFTKALSKLAGPGSTIYAVDKVESPLKQVVDADNITITTIKLDFTNGLGNISNLDGILMANSLHFVRDKLSLLNKLSVHLKSDGRLIIVEYNTDHPNTWVPHPVSLISLTALVRTNKLGMTSDRSVRIEKIGDAESNYQRTGMYCAMISFH